jgi:hypothetical protein
MSPSGSRIVDAERFAFRAPLLALADRAISGIPVSDARLALSDAEGRATKLPRALQPKYFKPLGRQSLNQQNERE